MLEIGFIEEMRTTWDNKELPQTFFHSSLYSRKYDFIRLTPYHFVTSQKAYGRSVLVA